MVKDEQWRPIAGFEGYYQVSDWGRVRSQVRVVNWRRSYGLVPRCIIPRLLAAKSTPRGHLYVCLHRDNKPHDRYVHHLVLETFIGPRPEGKEACHEDGNPGNNHKDNLRWDTHQANYSDDLRNHGRNAAAKLTAAEVRKIKKFLAQGRKVTDLARVFKVSDTAIYQIKRGKYWRHIDPA